MDVQGLNLTYPSDHELLATRLLDAPLDLVWEAFSRPEHLARWWGPAGFSNSFQEFDLRPGGHWRFTMHGPDGKDYPNHHVFTQVLPRQRIGLRFMEAPHFELTLSFSELDGRTLLTWHSQFGSAETWAKVMDYALPGLVQNIERFAEYSAGLAGAPPADPPSAREITSARDFDAPVERVFGAWIDPDQLAAWWGPLGFSNSFRQFEPRPGGAWNFTMHGPDGKDYPNQSVFLEVDAPRRLVFRHENGPRFLATVTFSDLGGRTRLLWRMLFDSAALYAQVKGYAVDGNRQNLDKLRDHLAKTPV